VQSRRRLRDGCCHRRPPHCFQHHTRLAHTPPRNAQERCLALLPRLNAWLEGWSASLAGAGLSPQQLLTFSNAKSEFWLYLVEMLGKLAEHPDFAVRHGV
jgi:hypothetical protein